MRRLSGNDPAVPPSVNAIQLGGFTAQELAPRAVHSATEDAPDGQPSYVLGTAVNLVAPTQGTITITGGVSGNIAGGGDNIAIGCRLTINDVEVPGSQRDVFLTPLGAPSGSCSTNAAKNVPKGTYEIELVINTSPGVSSLSQASVWAVWVPFNGLGNTPFVP